MNECSRLPLAVASLAAVAAVAAFGAVVVRAPLRPLPSTARLPLRAPAAVAARAAPPPAIRKRLALLRRRPLLGAVVAPAAAMVAAALAVHPFGRRHRRPGRLQLLPLLPPLGTAPLALVPLALPLLSLLSERLHLRLVRLLFLPSLLLSDVPLLLPPLPLLHTARHRVRHKLGGRLALRVGFGREVGRSEVGSSAAP